MEGTFNNKFQDATVEDVMNDPRKFGAPTFDEFVRNRVLWKNKLKKHDWFAEIEKSSTLLKGKMLKKQYYKFQGHKFNTLEAVDAAAADQGLTHMQLIPEPQVIPIGGGWCDLEVNFLTPTEHAIKKGVTKSGIIL